MRTKMDYKAAETRPERRSPRHLRHAGVVAAITAVVALALPFIPGGDAKSISAAESGSFQERRVLPLPVLEQQDAQRIIDRETGQGRTSLITIKDVIKEGDSMATLFARHNLSKTDLHVMTKLEYPSRILRWVQPGQAVTIVANDLGRVNSLVLQTGDNSRLEIVRDSEQFRVRTVDRPYQLRVAYAHGKIQSSLYETAHNAGMSDSLIMDLAGIFGWDIDYALDIRTGDEFMLLYEEIYRDGEKIRDGAILAAEFKNDGRIYRAVRFTDASGNADYYAPDGKAMRKEFLRAPLNFMYVSSNFNPRRLHPILKKVRAHRGIDYRAPQGTPVYAAGDGRVTRAAYDSNNGHHVFIQHGEKYTTKYLHFMRRAVRVGQKVRQGQVIGYVGSTGLATASHLHYEFMVSGVHRNPRRVKLPEAKPINKAYLQEFLAHSAPMLRQLEFRHTPDIIASAAP